MKQIFQNPKSGKTKLEEITSPIMRNGGILVKNRFSVISVGTERNIIELSKKSLLQKAKERPDYVQKFFMLMKTKGISAAWRVAQSKLSTDIALGYSTSGEAIAVAPGVEDVKTGDRVACAGQNYASHAEWIFVPKNLCVKIPENVSDKDAAFVTLGAIAMQGIRQANLMPGEKVGVIGMGLLGQLATRMLQGYGHPVMGFDINKEQINFAKENGMDAGFTIGSGNLANAVNAFTKNNGLDAVLIYASAKTDDPLKLAVEISRDKGRIVQIGNIETNIPWRDFYMKELSYTSSRSYGPGRYDKNYEEGGQDYPFSHIRWTEKRNMEEFLRLINDKKINIENLSSREFDISESEKAYELVSAPKGLIHGIVLKYPLESKPTLTIDIKKEESRALAPKEGIINIGIIGLGSFMNSTILPHLKEVKGARVKAVCHSQGLSAKKTAEKLGADYVTSDYKKLLEDKEIDLIICATRHSSHAKMAKEILRADKNLYIEKPLALNQEELEEVMEVAKNSKGRLLIGFNRSFSSHFIEAKNEFSSSATPIQIFYRINVGPLESIHWSYEEKEGGRILGEGCHFVHALQYIIGSKPKKVYMETMPAFGAIAHEENFTLIIEYENGSIGTVVYSALGNFRLPKEYIEIYGDGKIMIINNFKNAEIIYPNKTKKINLWHQDKGYTREIEKMVDAIIKGEPSPMPLEEIYLAHIASFKAIESAKIGQSVEL